MTMCLVVAAASFATEIFSYSSPRHKFSQAEVPEIQGIEPRREHQSFSDLRHEILSIIGGATKRLWISTPYLTDGEIATSLFMAKYRKLDVKVLLGRTKANGYMSRLGFLKQQNVPVFLMPADYNYSSSTLILSDDRLVQINADLDVKSQNHRYVSSEVADKETKVFYKSFAEATDKRIPAIPRPTPYVGRPGRFNNVYKSNADQPGRAQSSSYQTSRAPEPQTRSEDGSYNYNYKTPDKADPDMPKKLPKQTIQQKKFMEQFKKQGNK